MKVKELRIETDREKVELKNIYVSYHLNNGFMEVQGINNPAERFLFNLNKVSMCRMVQDTEQDKEQAKKPFKKKYNKFKR